MSHSVQIQFGLDNDVIELHPSSKTMSYNHYSQISPNILMKISDLISEDSKKRQIYIQQCELLIQKNVLVCHISLRISEMSVIILSYSSSSVTYIKCIRFSWFKVTFRIITEWYLLWFPLVTIDYHDDLSTRWGILMFRRCHGDGPRISYKIDRTIIGKWGQNFEEDQWLFM